MPVFSFIAIAVLMMAVVIFLVLLERKVLAWLTVRKGPNRVGPLGYFQTMADAIKLLTKEDIMSCGTNKIAFTLAPIIVFAPIMTLYCLVPYTDKLVAANIPLGLFTILAISSVSTIGIVMAGWSSGNKYSLLGGMRSAAQAISYEIPLVVTSISIALLTGTMNLHKIVGVQSGGVMHTAFLNWNVFSWNIWLGFVGFWVFLICSIAELNRVPFDLPEAESELVSGYNTEYSGMKFALFFLAEYAAMFVISAIIATLFLGGFLSPFNDYLANILFSGLITNKLILSSLVHLEQAFWLVGKTYAIIFLIIWIRATLPRLRADQLMSFCWKFLLPVSLINLFVTALIKLIF
ncbi:MAG: NADH-quinone oxidoreductase subunit NuoH [bacterium]